MHPSYLKNRVYQQIYKKVLADGAAGTGSEPQHVDESRLAPNHKLQQELMNESVDDFDSAGETSTPTSPAFKTAEEHLEQLKRLKRYLGQKHAYANQHDTLAILNNTSSGAAFPLASSVMHHTLARSPNARR